MAKRIFATVKPEILAWARTSAGLTVEASARALKVEPQTLEKWEAGDEERPSVPQLRSLALLYKRPLAAFYLQEVPHRFQVLSDLRRPVPGEDRSYSPSLTQEIRAAQQRRELAIEMRADLEEPVEPYPFRLANESPEEAGEKIRQFLGISEAHISKFGSDATGRIGLNTWRLALEKSGVLVFQSSRISQSEASGFALAYDSMPVVAVNRKDIPQRRLFSMIHEFAHVALRESGVSDLKIDVAEISDVELRCNSIAAATLMPTDFLAKAVDEIVGGSALSDEMVIRLARKFGVSRPAILLRLIGQGKLTWKFYREKVEQYALEYEREKAARPQPKDMKRNIPQESLSDLGRPFIGLVFDNYYQRRLTLSDVAGYLGIRVKHVESLQRRLEG